MLLLVLAVLPLAEPAVPAPQVESKQAEAQQVLAQIHELDADLGLVIESYNAAEIELDRIEAEQRENERRLKIARGNLGDAQTNLETRLVELYVAGQTDLIEILLGSTSLDEILDRLETANRVSSQDSKILEEVRRFRAEIERREAELEKAVAEQERVVAERAAKRREIESALAERERLLSSIKAEIERIRAQERAEQRALEAEARARLDAQPPATDSGGGGEVPTAAPPSQYGGVVGIAMQYLGVPYLWGGASPSTGFDCSGFSMYVYAQVGVSLPHNAAMQYGYGTPVSRSELQPGDLVFFNGLGHMGIYIGGGQFIHSPHTGDVVKISSMTGWYASTYVGARRL
ncbi:MAG TPA: NlpC/P60 family protein [Gaiellaceae bacterium]|nr:NlpC/P60 family protein [Gaiellaceae bacterium]